MRAWLKALLWSTGYTEKQKSRKKLNHAGTQAGRFSVYRFKYSTRQLALVDVFCDSVLFP
jgi:hypothetical protein